MKTKKNSTRDKSTIKRLKMVKSSKPIRSKTGKIIKEAPFQSRLPSGTQARIQPNRKWFGNTRTIQQDSLQKFRDDFTSALKDPYQIIMTQSKLPTTLLHQKLKHNRPQILQVTKFQECFGKSATRKRPNIGSIDYEELLSKIDDTNSKYEKCDKEKDTLELSEFVDDKSSEIFLPSDTVFNKGQSKRIWNELYKVIDSADVLLQILDARDPLGTRSRHIENFLRQHKSHKHLVLVLNKCDLIPTWVCKKWVALFSSEYPTIAFKASLNTSFGKGSMINLLRQFAKLHPERKQISVGFFGYPNVGKSSIINALKSKKVCEVAPTPGHTKVWQYISLMNRIYLIDCPGVVYPEGNSESELILKGVVRVENVKDPENHVQALIDKMPKPLYLLNTYNLNRYYPDELKEALNAIVNTNLGENNIESSGDLVENIKFKLESIEFLTNLALRMGKLLKGGQPDISTAAKMVLYDWQRGKIPFFTLPPTNSAEPLC